MPTELPDDFPDWATGTPPAETIVAPPTQKQMDGWRFNEPVPAKVLNWFMYYVGKFQQYFHGLAQLQWQENWIALDLANGSGDDFSVVQRGTPAMAVDVHAGQAFIHGAMRYFAATSNLAIAAAHATLPRIDIVYADEDGVVAVRTGTANASPTAPAVTYPSEIKVAEVYVAALVTTILTANITNANLTNLGPVGNGAVKLGGLNHNRLSVGTVYVALGTPSIAGDVATITVDLFFPDGVTAYTGPFGDGNCNFIAELFTDTWTTAWPVNGWSLNGDLAGADAATPDGNNREDMEHGNPGAMWYLPITGSYESSATGVGRLFFFMEDASGSIKVERTNTPNLPGTYYLMIRPLNRPGACEAFATIVFT